MAERARRVRERRRVLRKILIGALGLLVIGVVGGGTYYFKMQAKKSTPETPSEPLIQNQEPGVVICRKEICVLANTEGITLREIPRPSGNLLLTIEQTGEVPKTGEEVLEAAVLEELMFIRKRAAEEFSLHLGKAVESPQTPQDFTFETNEGWQLKLSTHNNAYATIGVLARVLEELGGARSGLEYVDLRIENRVYYKTR